MRKFRFKKFLLGLTLSLSSFTLASCSSFFGTNQGKTIDQITSSIDENGNTIISITFTDETVAPINVTIPRGVGIDHIDSSISEDNAAFNLIIYYSDENVEPTTLSFPLLKGDEGTGVSDVSCEMDENGNYNLYFYMTDGTTYGPFPITNGKDGKEITDIEASTNDETGYTLITVTFSDGSVDRFEIELGKDGAGIESIVPSEIGNEYILNITFTDGTSTSVRFEKPRATKRYYGQTIPSPSLGNEGDFYIDQSTRTFYTKASTGWIQIFSLDENVEPEKFTVTFDVNGGEWEWIQSGIPDSDTRTFTFEYGSLIDLDNVELQVKKEGYTFNGWWTDSEINANSGHFTKLSPVLTNLTLYANWLVE